MGFYKVTVTSTATFFVEAESVADAETLAGEALADEHTSRTLDESQIGVVSLDQYSDEGVNEDENYVVFWNDAEDRIDIR